MLNLGVAMTNLAQAKEPANRQYVLSKALINAADHLALPKGKLAQILGVSPATISRLYAQTYQLSSEKKEWEFAVLLLRLFRSLDSIVGGSAQDARKWLTSPNQGLGGHKPVVLIEKTEGLVRVVNYLDAYRSII